MTLKIHEIAAALLENDLAQQKIEEMLKPLKESEETLRQQMLETLKRSRLASFRAEDTGFTYTRAFRGSLDVVEGKEKEAMKWAAKNDCLKLDTMKANKLLRGVGALPVGFEQKETEYLTIKKDKNN